MAAANNSVTEADVDQDIRSRVRVAQMGMVFEQTSIAVFAATAFAFALAMHLRGDISDQVLAWWVGIKVAIVIPRIIHGHMFLRRRSNTLKWLTWGQAMLFLDGLVWGLAGVFLMPANDIATMTAVIATLAGVSAIAAFVLHADWRSCIAYTAPMQVPGVIVMLSRGDGFGLYGAFSILIFYTLLLLATRRLERHIVEMLTLRYQNEELTAKLSSALDLANTENRAKNEFVANMSHELRTPLHGILGVSSMMTSDVPSTNAREGISVIQRCGEHLLGLINNILEYSRFGAHGIDLHPQAVDMTQLIDDTVEMCAPSAAEKGLTLTSVLDLPRPFIVNLDPFRTRQVLLNLVGNAVKFTEKGSVRVRVAASNNGGSVLIRVEDTGVGIAPTALNRIFEPFVQVDSSNTRKFGGTGLGLSITRAICEAMHGSITYRSVLGQGSTFEVNLPVVKPSESMSAAGDTAHLPAAGIPLRGTVLLAEDNDVNALVADAALKQIGMTVERASTGREVVRRICQTETPRPDLVLLDCQMPEMDGFEAARRVREFEAEHGLPRMLLIALTANVFPEDRAQCHAAGMDDFLAKPFSYAQLRDMIATHLGATH